MKFEPLRKYLLKKRGAIEDTPFGPESLVFKVMGKMFALVAWDETPLRITLKCDPDLAQILRAQYQAVQPGYYMNKKHWNTIEIGKLPHKLIIELIDHSYDLVVENMPKKIKETLQNL